ncbi:MAG: APC family permease [bacterium]
MKKLDRELGLFSVFSISCGAMIGSGIFVLPGLASTIGGPLIFAGYLIAGFLVIPAALSKAEMATAMPESGGTYLYLDRSLGPLAGTLSGLGTWISLLLKSAFALVGLSAYLIIFTPVSYSMANYWGAGIALLLIISNCLGAKLSGKLQSYLVLGTLVVLFVFIGRGSISIEKAHFDQLLPHGITGLLSSVAFIFVSYAGVTKIASVAEEIEDPGNNIPWGIMLSLVTMMQAHTGSTGRTVLVGRMGEVDHGICSLHGPGFNG